MSIPYSDAPSKGANNVVASFIYDDGDGHPIARIDRIEHRDGKKSFLPYAASGNGFASRAGLNGAKLHLYKRTDVLRIAAEHGTIVLVEGEGKGDAVKARLGRNDIAVTTVALGAHAELTDDHVADFAGARRVIILCDSDEPGRKCGAIRAQRILAMHPEADVRVVDLRSGPG